MDWTQMSSLIWGTIQMPEWGGVRNATHQTCQVGNLHVEFDVRSSAKHHMSTWILACVSTAPGWPAQALLTAMTSVFVMTGHAASIAVALLLMKCGRNIADAVPMAGDRAVQGRAGQGKFSKFPRTVPGFVSTVPGFVCPGRALAHSW